MCFSERAEIFKCRNQQTDWQGRNNLRTIDHSHLGGPQADHSYVHIHSRHPPVGEWSLDSLCQAKAEGQQFPHRMSSPHPWHQLVDKVPNAQGLPVPAMSADWIPRDIYCGKLASGKRPQGRLQLRYKDVFKRDIKKLWISIQRCGRTLQQTAARTQYSQSTSTEGGLLPTTWHNIIYLVMQVKSQAAVANVDLH